MKLTFPEGFIWGTATAAVQIESASDHQWKNHVASDGTILDRAIEHEKHREEDAALISSLGNAYRCSLDWARLQPSPGQPLESTVVEEYRDFLGNLKDAGMHIMLVLFHGALPRWLSDRGGWADNAAPGAFADYVEQVSSAFGDLVASWNTINEPWNYTSLAYLFRHFPPKEQNPFSAARVLRNLTKAHKAAYTLLKERFPEKPVGVSNNAMVFEGETLLGRAVAKVADLAYLRYVPDRFRDVDFIGLSYYGRIPFRPGPISEVTTPGELDRLGREHDMMWEYHPSGLYDVLQHFWKRYEKPIIITEHGCCTDDDDFRIRSITDHLSAAHQAIQDGVDLRGYFHWSTFDNFEWNLGRSYRFGLYDVAPDTLKRTAKKSAAFYAEIARSNSLDLSRPPTP